MESPARTPTPTPVPTPAVDQQPSMPGVYHSSRASTPTAVDQLPSPGMDHPSRASTQTVNQLPYASTPTINQHMVASRTRKRNAHPSGMEARREEETSDSNDSDWIPEKVRAVAGPGQTQLDQVWPCYPSKTCIDV